MNLFSLCRSANSLRKPLSSMFSFKAQATMGAFLDSLTWLLSMVLCFRLCIAKTAENFAHTYSNFSKEEDISLAIT